MGLEGQLDMARVWPWRWTGGWPSGTANIGQAEKDIRNRLMVGEHKALEMLVQVFDWLDDCKPLPTTEIVNLYEMSQDIEVAITDTLAQIDQGGAKKMKINKLMADLKHSSNVSPSHC